VVVVLPASTWAMMPMFRVKFKSLLAMVVRRSLCRQF
jgi:hypothetical protein